MSSACGAENGGNISTVLRKSRCMPDNAYNDVPCTPDFAYNVVPGMPDNAYNEVP